MENSEKQLKLKENITLLSNYTAEEKLILTCCHQIVECYKNGDNEALRYRLDLIKRITSGQEKISYQGK